MKSCYVLMSNFQRGGRHFFPKYFHTLINTRLLRNLKQANKEQSLNNNIFQYKAGCELSPWSRTSVSQSWVSAAKWRASAAWVPDTKWWASMAWITASKWWSSAAWISATIWRASPRGPVPRIGSLQSFDSEITIMLVEQGLQRNSIETYGSLKSLKLNAEVHCNTSALTNRKTREDQFIDALPV
ncbi:hypothetical protein Y032_0065g3622 [Ancylostoma ceylanicum]|uniref:Uncharacterized protein n=1 Tax=Ancylostoma ceylanicum TaxID=53326 RepID=A0A016U1X3_9BILA|nr:hypothetical protein Y032_0065g3622 [Ancylostoma ceylanicum]